MRLGRTMDSGHKLAFLLAFVLLAMVRPEWVAASPITYDFTGTVPASSGIDGVNAGDTFSGTLSYDTDLVPVSTPDYSNPFPNDPPTLGVYQSPAGTNLIGLQIKVGSQTFGIDNPGTAGVLVAPSLSDDVFGTSSNFFMVTVADATEQKIIEFHLASPPGPVLTTADLPTSLDLSKFTGDNGIFFSDTSADPDTIDSPFFEGSLTSLTPVPEPSTLALFTLAIFGYGFRRVYCGKPYRYMGSGNHWNRKSG
jgi:hypothetical protein